MFKDYYRILDVPLQASAQEIKSAYRAKSMKWHPDKNPGKDATRIMQDINEAYAILKDSAKRQRYDMEYAAFLQRMKSVKVDFETGICTDRGKSASADSSRNDTAGSSAEWEYDYTVCDDSLNEDIKEARKYAKDLVDEFMKSFRQAASDASHGVWEAAKGYLLGGLILTILSLLYLVCLQ